MTFHDGSPVTAKDFVFAFDRIALKANASDLAYLLHDVVGFGDVNQTGTAGHMSGLSAPDDLTLVIRLSRPYQDLPSVLTHPALVPLSRRAVSSPDRFLTEPTGNGPFQIAQPWSPGQSVILKAFPGFIQTPDLDGIRFLAYPDAAASWIDFVKGDVDVSEVPAGQVSDAANRFGERGFVPFLKAEYVGVNVGSGNLKDPTLRKAINLAIDRAALARTVYNGTLQEPRGIVPAGLPGFEENLCVDLCRFDPDTAAALVKNLPKKERRVELSFTKGVPQTRAANAIARFLRHAGLKASVKGYDFPPYLKLLQSGGQELYRLGWIAEYPSADVFLDPLFSSGSPDNHSGFASTTVDRMLAQAHSSPSPGKRLHLYVEAERAILKALPIIPIGSFVTHWAARPEVKEIHFDVMGGFDANQVFVSGG
jgi:peptide/nickel transport system substrate-binding protein/oligopeptide transport system substrate-binding protein